jgi:predicted transcriptional regulator
MRNRSRVDTLAQILDAARNGGGITKTQITCKAFVNYEQLKEYLATLLDSELIECDPKNSLYRTTEKGLRFLKMHTQMSEIMHIQSSHNDSNAFIRRLSFVLVSLNLSLLLSVAGSTLVSGSY